MRTLNIVLIAVLFTLSVTAAMAMADQYQAAPNVGGKGPGMGHDYRRNIAGPGVHGGAGPSDSVRKEVPTSSFAENRSLYRQTPGATRPPGLGYPGYPLRDLRLPGAFPGYAAPFSAPRYGYGQWRNRRGLGYGYPGYRGQGGSPYPRHRQYGNPPGIPRGPMSSGTGVGN